MIGLLALTRSARLLTAPALADPSGHGAISRAPDGIKAGLVFPEYSETISSVCRCDARREAIP
jgi:hypothetical protein